MNYWKILWSWCMPANTYSEYFRITVATFYSSELGGLGPICPVSQACQDCFLTPAQMHFSVPPLCEDWMAFFSGIRLCRHCNFPQDKWAHQLCFWMFGSDLLWVTHQFCSKPFFIITSICCSTSVQNAIVRHVPRAIATFHDTSVQTKQRRPSV